MSTKHEDQDEEKLPKPRFWGLYTWLLNKVINDTSPIRSNDAKDVALRHGLRITKLTFWTILIGAAFLFLIVDLDSPNYSILGLIGSALSQSHSAIGAPPSSSEGSGYIFKMLFIIAAGALLFFQVHMSTPFADPALLNRIKARIAKYPKSVLGRKLMISIGNDIKAYADHLPSLHAQKLCSVCDHAGACKGNIRSSETFASDNTFPIWQTLYRTGGLNAPTLAHTNNSAYLCRLVFNIKIICIDVLIFGVLSYLSHRGLEFLFRPSVEFPVLPLLIIVVATIFYTVVAQLNDSSEPNDLGGVWSRLANSTKEMGAQLKRGCSAYEDVYREKVCLPRGDGTTFSQSLSQHRSTRSHSNSTNLQNPILKLIIEAVTQIDLIMMEKLALLLAKKKFKGLQIDHTKAIQDALVCFLQSVFPTAAPFNVFTSNDLTVKDFIILNGQNQVTRTVREGLAEKEDDLGHFCLSSQTHPGAERFFKDDIKSVFIAKIAFSRHNKEHLINRLSDLQVSAPSLECDGFAWIYITSASPDIFVEGADVAVFLPLLLFIHRLAFEHARESTAYQGESYEAVR